MLSITTKLELSSAEAYKGLGEELIAKLTVPVNPFTGTILSKIVLVEFWTSSRDDGDAAKLISFGCDGAAATIIENVVLAEYSTPLMKVDAFMVA